MKKEGSLGYGIPKGSYFLPYPFASWNISWALGRFFLTWGFRFFLFLKCTIWKPLAQCFDSRCGVFDFGKRVFKYQAKAFLFRGKGFKISSMGFSILSIGVFILNTRGIKNLKLALEHSYNLNFFINMPNFHKAQSPNLVLEIKNTPCLESKIPC